VWNLEQQMQIRDFPGHTDWPIALTPDGSRIVCAAADATIQVLAADTGVELFWFSGHDWDTRQE
jgi:WD40 repeat protein